MGRSSERDARERRGLAPRAAIAAGIAALVLSACGGGGGTAETAAATASAADSGVVAESSDGLDPEAAAEANISLLQPSEQVADFEVLNVADGSIATLRDVVDGDRPVLLWFYSPH